MPIKRIPYIDVNTGKVIKTLKENVKRQYKVGEEYRSLRDSLLKLGFSEKKLFDNDVGYRLWMYLYKKGNVIAKICMIVNHEELHLKGPEESLNKLKKDLECLGYKFKQGGWITK